MRQKRREKKKEETKKAGKQKWQENKNGGSKKRWEKYSRETKKAGKKQLKTKMAGNKLHGAEKKMAGIEKGGRFKIGLRLDCVVSSTEERSGVLHVKLLGPVHAARTQHAKPTPCTQGTTNVSIFDIEDSFTKQIEN
jgi:hypothetical protein